MACSISGGLLLVEICRTNNEQASSYNKNKKNDQTSLNQARNQRSNNKITITQHHTHFISNVPNTTSGASPPRRGCLLPVSWRRCSSGTLAYFPSSLVNQPLCRKIDSIQAGDRSRAIERLSRHRLYFSFHAFFLQLVKHPIFKLSNASAAVVYNRTGNMLYDTTHCTKKPSQLPCLQIAHQEPSTHTRDTFMNTCNSSSSRIAMLHAGGYSTFQRSARHTSIVRGFITYQVGNPT